LSRRQFHPDGSGLGRVAGLVAALIGLHGFEQVLDGFELRFDLPA
jgi:hypothetical protein